MTTTAAKPGTHDYYMNQMTELADRLEREGNHEGAADVRNDIRVLSTPRPQAQIRCDSCGDVVRSARQVAKYDSLGVDWVHCAKCDSRG